MTGHAPAASSPGSAASTQGLGDDIHADASRDHLLGESLREVDDRRLRRMRSSAALHVWDIAKMFVRNVCSSSHELISSSLSCDIW
jgi:hypothetical protein